MSPLWMMLRISVRLPDNIRESSEYLYKMKDIQTSSQLYVVPTFLRKTFATLIAHANCAAILGFQLVRGFIHISFPFLCLPSFFCLILFFYLLMFSKFAIAITELKGMLKNTRI